MTKKKQPTMEIKPTDGQITSETTLGINDPEIVEAEVIPTSLRATPKR